jgi:hypothetical protein
LRQRDGVEHRFPWIRSLRASLQGSTSVLFSFVLSFGSGRIIHHPAIKNESWLPNNVRSLAMAMRDVQQGNFNIQLPVGSTHEVGRLTDSFNFS